MSNSKNMKNALKSHFKHLVDQTYHIQEADHLTMVRFRKERQSNGLSLYLIDSNGPIMISLKTLKRIIEICGYQKRETTVPVSYIIVNRYIENLLIVASRIDALLLTKKTLMIGLDGFASAGKTTLSKYLGLIYEANVYHTDDFFKKPEPSEDILSHFGANIDFQTIQKTIVEPIKSHALISYRPFDFKTHQHLSPIQITYKPVHIFEGAFVFHPYLDIDFDLKIFYDIRLFKQYVKIAKRNGLKGLKQFMFKWIPNERQYVKALKIKQKVDIIIE